MEFDTILSEEEIANNLSKIIKDDKNISHNILTFIFGDITYDFKMNGYIKDNNFYLLSYLNYYRKNIEIKGHIQKIGNLCKVTFNVNWLKRIDIIFYYLFCALVIFPVLSFEGIHPLIITIVFLITFLMLIWLVIIINKKIISALEKKIFKIIMKSKFIGIE
jgi:hypothetical protein